MTDFPPWLKSSISKIGQLHDGPDVVRLAREIGQRFPRMTAYCATAKPTTPWCGIHAGHELMLCGIAPPYNPADDEGSFMYVDSYANTDWGGTHIQPGYEQPGDIITLRNPHHVTILKEVRGANYICVGGNQGNDQGGSVTESTYARSGLMAIIRPPAIAIEAKPIDPPRTIILDAATIDYIAALTAHSDLARWKWQGRGRAPTGFIAGMAVTYAQALVRLAAGDGVARATVRVVDAPNEHDVFDHLEEQILAGGWVIAAPDIDRLRLLWVILTGLGMRESSGGEDIGRDTSASNTSADSAEAGAWQQSWDSRGASPELPKLLAQYGGTDPDQVDRIFARGVNIRPGSLENFGDGPGLAFQALAKARPSIAVLFAAIGLRTLRNHWGPINRAEVELVPAADALFREVETIITGAKTMAEPADAKDTTGPQPAPLQVPAPNQIPGFPIKKIDLGTAVEFVKNHKNESFDFLSLLNTVHNSLHPDKAITLPPAPVAPSAPAADQVTQRTSVKVGAGVLAISSILQGAGFIPLPFNDPNITAHLVSTLSTLLPIAVAGLGMVGGWGPIAAGALKIVGPMVNAAISAKAAKDAADATSKTQPK